MADQARAAAHWDDAYAHGDDTRSWFEEQPDMSLRMLDAAGVLAADALIDVGGGASPLTGALLDRGFRDLTVLDISAAGMQHARDRTPWTRPPPGTPSPSSDASHRTGQNAAPACQWPATAQPSLPARSAPTGS
jgi:hypothetical protein